VRSTVLVLVLAAGAVLVPLARADGDPASDALITSQVFYPYYSNAPKASLVELTGTVAAANKRGYPIRVAVITSPYDLGSVSALWGKPQPYARFLSLELSFAYKRRLLVVSPRGYGYVDRTKPVPAKLALVRTVPIGKGTDGLLQTADRAVRILAAKDGVALPAVHVGTGSSSSSDTIVIGIAAAVCALLVVAGEFARRSRRRRRLEVSAEEGGQT
jgi:hypothetical protein